MKLTFVKKYMSKSQCSEPLGHTSILPEAICVKYFKVLIYVL